MESINVSFDDQKITGLNEDSHDKLVFENEATLDPEEGESDTDVPSNPDGPPNPDEAPISDDVPDDYDSSYVEGEHGEQQQTVTETPKETNHTSGGQDISDTDSGRNPDDTSGNESNISGGASTDSSSFEENSNPGGASTSRNNLTPARRWTKSHTPDLIIEDPDAGVQTRNAKTN